ncbi:VOC family protein [Pseudoclavibacter terrae]|uniref:VOC family protein n=1 Tax=Pseudoclavibacter terrae TaxID=1530195 RepID=A0A7J5B493_9MICO|nr:VOC family protein [Pseudoclavibacter terrae]KAB1638966.1 VOC family protein [Pseudoclavibacter terrae]
MSDNVNYFEIGTTDPEAVKAFYGDTFGWTFGSLEPGGYGMVDGAGNGGGLWDSNAVGGGSWAVFYVEVDHIEAKLEQAAANGAETVIPLVDNGTIKFAHLRDPLGNRFGVWERRAQG